MNSSQACNLFHHLLSSVALFRICISCIVQKVCLEFLRSIVVKRTLALMFQITAFHDFYILDVRPEEQYNKKRASGVLRYSVCTFLSSARLCNTDRRSFSYPLSKLAPKAQAKLHHKD